VVRRSDVFRKYVLEDRDDCLAYMTPAERKSCGEKRKKVWVLPSQGQRVAEVRDCLRNFMREKSFG